MSDILAMLSEMDLSRSALIGCEESGVVRRAFAARGIDAWASTSHGGLQFDAFRVADIGRAHQEGHMCESAYGLCE